MKKLLYEFIEEEINYFSRPTSATNKFELSHRTLSALCSLPANRNARNGSAVGLGMCVCVFT